MMERNMKRWRRRDVTAKSIMTKARRRKKRLRRNRGDSAEGTRMVNFL
jgi:hypothetical protein